MWKRKLRLVNTQNFISFRVAHLYFLHKMLHEYILLEFFRHFYHGLYFCIWFLPLSQWNLVKLIFCSGVYKHILVSYLISLCILFTYFSYEGVLYFTSPQTVTPIYFLVQCEVFCRMCCKNLIKSTLFFCSNILEGLILNTDAVCQLYLWWNQAQILLISHTLAVAFFWEGEQSSKIKHILL